MNCKIVKLGTFYMDGRAVPAPRYPAVNGDVPAYNGETLSIKGTVPGKELTWVKPAGTDILVCDRNILCWVSFEDLQRAGFVDGRVVRIDGKFYCCRLIQNRRKIELSDTNELERLIGSVPNPEVEMYTRLMSSLFCAVGWPEPAEVFYCGRRAIDTPQIESVFVSRAAKGPDIGFRPVLEPCIGAVRLTRLNTGDKADM